MAPATNAVCRLTERLARFSPDSASSKWPKPRSDGNAPVHEPASPANTTVASGATKTTNTTTAKIPSRIALLRLLHNNIRAPLPSIGHHTSECHAIERVEGQRQRDLHG